MAGPGPQCVGDCLRSPIRLRNGGSQVGRVEHVHINEGGQAVIGNISAEEVTIHSAIEQAVAVRADYTANEVRNVI
jgi:hypothetical protein